ncbi:hypothetical protein R1sor_000550 [Riccia sorocarpa]|uniref:Uncharacterized protein n=1 Tax=Riccia sorocarpa TaxID=122646 RepID=A0ABD3GTP7_9MARC
MNPSAVFSRTKLSLTVGFSELRFWILVNLDPEVAPPQNDSDAAMNEVIVESEDDEAILLHRDDENNEDNEENDPAEGPVGEDENPEDAEETSDQAERQDDPVDVVPDSLTGGDEKNFTSVLPEMWAIKLPRDT